MLAFTFLYRVRVLLSDKAIFVVRVVGVGWRVQEERCHELLDGDLKNLEGEPKDHLEGRRGGKGEETAERGIKSRKGWQLRTDKRRRSRWSRPWPLRRSDAGVGRTEMLLVSALIEATLRKEKKAEVMVSSPIELLGGVLVGSRLITTES